MGIPLKLIAVQKLASVCSVALKDLDDKLKNLLDERDDVLEQRGEREAEVEREDEDDVEDVDGALKDGGLGGGDGGGGG